MTILLKFLAMLVVVEVSYRLLDRCMREAWRPWALTLIVTAAAVAMLWV